MLHQNDPPANNDQLSAKPLSYVWLNQEEVMKRLKIGITVLKNLRKNGHLKCSKLEGLILFNEDDVQDMLLRHRKLNFPR